jgi:diguanylate cyclase (GGDEF)-like protein
VWAPGGSGLAIWDRGKWTRLKTTDGLRADGVRKPAAATDGSIWFSYTDSYGLARVHIDDTGLKITHFDRGKGPESDLAYFVGADRSGAIWAGTENGVDVFDGERWRHYSQDDGLVWNDCNTNGFFEDEDGSIWIGTSRGLAHFRNPSERRPMEEPSILLSSIKAHGVAQPLGEPFRLPYAKNSLEITYLSPWYRNEARISFEHRLLGLSSAWVASSDRRVRYDRLPAGDYTFEIRSRAPGIKPRRPPLVARFSIARPWWQTWWFYTAVLAGALLLIAAIWRWRNAVLLARKWELETAVEDRTRQLQAEKSMLMIAREALHQMATTDELTGLWNRRAILDFLQRELARAERDGLPLSIIMLDLDRFKWINDTFGHVVGDSALRTVADRLVETVRMYDGIGRYGGEELLLVLPGCDGAEAADRAEELRRAVESLRIVHDDVPELIHLTCSAGVAWRDENARSAQQLLTAADTALYLAKRNGRNQVAAMTGGSALSL